jgi:hypothetical protein
MIDRVRVPRSSRRAWITGTLAALAIPWLLGGRAMAGLTIEVQPANTNAVAGSSNNVLDLLLISDSTTPPGASLASFNVVLSAPSGSGINFTGADTMTGYPYVFAGDVSGGFTFTPGANSAGLFDYANDLDAPIVPSTTYGLGEIFFSVDPGATPGMYPATISTLTTSLTGGPPDFFNLPYGTTNGQITVVAASVPEPSTAVMTILGLAAVGSAWVRRRRAD